MGASYQEHPPQFIGATSLTWITPSFGESKRHWPHGGSLIRRISTESSAVRPRTLSWHSNGPTGLWWMARWATTRPPRSAFRSNRAAQHNRIRGRTENPRKAPARAGQKHNRGRQTLLLSRSRIRPRSSPQGKVTKLRTTNSPPWKRKLRHFKTIKWIWKIP